MALTRMQQRRGTASQWAAENPILGSGEIGFETDNNRFKIGDGVTDWATLQYFSNKEDVDAAIASAIADVIDLAPETLDTLNEIAAAINDDPDFFNTISTSLGTKVSKSGDTMTGDLTLPNDPTQNLHAATKQYVDQAETDANTYTDGEISSLIASGETTTPGGAEGQVLAKASDDDFDTEWVTPTGLLGDLADVQTYEVLDKDTLVYDDELGLWLPGPGGGRFNVSETPPTEPLNGDTWLDSITGNTYLYYEDLDSPQWIQIGGPGIASVRGASLFIQTTAPANPVEGDIWYDSAEGFTYLYYVDADSSQWIQFGLNRNGAPGDSFSLSSIDEITDVNVTSPANGDSLVYDGTEWVNEALSLTSTIEDLTDTTIASPSEGDTMVYDGSSWINTTATPGNLVINGSFLVNQRGVISETPTISNGYVIDRWYLRQANSVSHEVTHLKNQFVNGFGFSNVLKISNFYDSAWVGQRIEFQNYPFLSEKEVTVSFYAKADSPISDLRVFLHEGSDSGNHGAPYFTTTGAVNTAWQKYSYTMTTGTLAMDQINGNFLLGFGQQTTDTTFYLAGVQLEVGSVATPFRPAGDGSYAAELALCRRYYASVSGLMSRFYNYSSGSANVTLPSLLPTTMRVTPTITAVIDVNDGTPTSPTAIFVFNTSHFFIQQNGVPSGQFVDLSNFEADAEL